MSKKQKKPAEAYLDSLTDEQRAAVQTLTSLGWKFAAVWVPYGDVGTDGFIAANLTGPRLQGVDLSGGRGPFGQGTKP